MIKRLLLAGCFFFPAFAHAQIVLDSSDMGSIGQSVIMQYDTSYTGTTGSMGAAQLWNFSSLSPAMGFEDTVRFLSPFSIPNGPTVPNANMVMQIGGQNTYVQKTAVKLDILALNIQFDTLVNGVQTLNPPLRYINFPTTYLDNKQTSTAFTFTLPFDTTVTAPVFGTVSVDSIRITANFNHYDTINGHGIIQLPSGIAPALRQHSRQIISFSAEAGASLPFLGFFWLPFPLPIPDLHSSTYSYFGKGREYPLLEITTDSAGTVQGASFQVLNVSSVQSESANRFNIAVYPNPATDQVQIDNRVSEAVTLQLYDLSGRRIGQEKTIQPGQTTFDLRNIESGIYILRFVNGKGELRHWQKIVKQ